MRPKIGFCNCDTGVADDDEVDRVADLDLISPQVRAARAGKVVRVADMSGRARAYDLTMSDGAQPCRGRHRAVAALRSAGRGGAGQGRAPDELQRAALDYLGVATTMHRWMMAALGGR